MPIEQNSSDLERILNTDQQIGWLGSGYGGDGGPAEGPLWWHEGGCLLFSDIHNNRRMKWTPGGGVSVFQQPTNHANGLTRDLKGRLIACEHSARRVTRQDADGEVTVIAASYRGRRLNRPNDAVVKSDGSIYFTDPGAPGPGLDLDYSGVYMVSPDLGEITMIVGDFLTPNGIAFSPDESVLYVNDTRRQHIRAFDRSAQRHARAGVGPRAVRPKRRPPRRAGRDEGGRRGEHILRRIRRRLGDRRRGQPPRHGRARRGRDHKRRVRRGRLADALLHDLEHGRKRPSERSGHSGSYGSLAGWAYRASVFTGPMLKFVSSRVRIVSYPEALPAFGRTASALRPPGSAPRTS